MCWERHVLRRYVVFPPCHFVAARLLRLPRVALPPFGAPHPHPALLIGPDNGGRVPERPMVCAHIHACMRSDHNICMYFIHSYSTACRWPTSHFPHTNLQSQWAQHGILFKWSSRPSIQCIECHDGRTVRLASRQPPVHQLGCRRNCCRAMAKVSFHRDLISPWHRRQ